MHRHMRRQAAVDCYRVINDMYYYINKACILSSYYFAHTAYCISMCIITYNCALCLGGQGIQSALCARAALRTRTMSPQWQLSVSALVRRIPSGIYFYRFTGICIDNSECVCYILFSILRCLYAYIPILVYNNGLTLSLEVPTRFLLDCIA